ncbi:hypothetical protein BaRGS_00036323 [Batillaria attramentaria]|uniref:Fibrinogen C-terminal domain-containing protein n=1 Tax=Batillaria attramentaria TaxID=370345 RepID=A0ABD0JC84_9CAEN
MITVGGRNIKVFCDQRRGGGGWTVIQRRKDGLVNFDRNWQDYVDGFGNPRAEFWLGLHHMHVMTSNRAYILRVDLADTDDSTAYAEYDVFRVSGSDTNYELTVFGYSGTAGDSLTYHSFAPFSTKDRDNNRYTLNCVEQFGQNVGWWYRYCFHANLNMPVWFHWKDWKRMKSAEMKIKPA